MVARSDASGFPPERPKKPTPNPWIGVSTGGSIVLFTKESEGTVIGHTTIATPSTITNNPFGMHTISWVSSYFVPYAGKVTLYNE